MSSADGTAAVVVRPPVALMDGRRERRGPWSNLSGARLPIADPPQPAETPCDRDASHTGGIRFQLVRYGRVVGIVRLCGDCFMTLNPRQPADPLDVTIPA